MKRILLALICVFCLATTMLADEFRVTKIYEKKDLPEGTKMIDEWGSLKTAKSILLPTTLKEGKYSIQVSRVDSNLYQIVGTDYYLETQYCYEYAIREDVILVVPSTYSYSSIKLIFLE